eukprot:gnl/MRDRNA2_/MRDRNA2_89618_c0_seq1.p1 gnl/MRDRNA2_/MRDRNA2_89618_c0~~gnl/MRDRNA2_/MRDRNA2_89618_c0_seq1.p1  ORF type:complete len:266 (+),score=50.40 gnl/MRDRNA2_/MRDRNA2_89618_c0_seq1:84-881(+)
MKILMLQVRRELRMMFMLGFSHVCCFCPAGFDDGFTEDSDELDEWLESSAEEVPSVVSQSGQICDWYWGSDEGETGYWDHLAGEAGEDYWNCYGFEKSKLVEQYGPDAINSWPEDMWHQKRLVIDKRCMSPALCAIERSERGWCSMYYAEKVMLDCGPEDSYRMKYCAEVCPPQENRLKDDEKLCKNSSQEDVEFSEKFSEAGPRPSKCPVIRAGKFIKNKATEAGKAALKMLSSFMPALLMPPEAASPAVVSTSAVLPTPVSLR